MNEQQTNVLVPPVVPEPTPEEAGAIVVVPSAEVDELREEIRALRAKIAEFHYQPAVGDKLNLIGLRDTLLALRDATYCPLCHYPEWASDRATHYLEPSPCKLGVYTEALLKIAPKEGASVKWRKG